MAARRAKKTRLQELKEEALEKGLYVATWAPGDGVTRYRFFENSGNTYFGPENGIYTALGLKEAYTFLAGSRAASRDVRKVHEYAKTGSFIVHLLEGGRKKKQKRFHDFPRANAWATGELERGLPGDAADFYRARVDRGHRRGEPGHYEGAPWTQPFHRLEVGDNGRLVRGDLRNSPPVRRSARKATRDRSRLGELPGHPDYPKRGSAPRVRVERGPMQVAWHASGGRLAPVSIVWNGPGSRLFLLWHGQMVPIEHPKADGNYRDFASADRAARAFVRAEN